jgi:hypothetical protein
MLADVGSRWGVAQGPIFIAAIIMAALAVLLSTIGVISFLTAGDGETLQKFDAEVWFWVATGLAIGAAAFCILLRLQGKELTGAPDPSGPDLPAGLVLQGLTLAFIVAMLIKGFDESFDAVFAWASYAEIFAVLAIAWFVITRPTPKALAGLDASVVGMGAVAAALVVLVIGLFQGRSEDFSTYVQGVAFLRGGIVVMLLAFAWFIGMRREAA